MKKIISVSGAIGYVLISGFIITLLLLSVVDLGQDRLKDDSSAEVYAAMSET